MVSYDIDVNIGLKMLKMSLILLYQLIRIQDLHI